MYLYYVSNVVFPIERAEKDSEGVKFLKNNVIQSQPWKNYYFILKSISCCNCTLQSKDYQLAKKFRN